MELHFQPMNFRKYWRTHKKGILGLLIVAVLIVWLGFIKTGLFPFLFQLTFNRDISLRHSDDRINILLLGIGGQGHDGPNLTDTIIFASIDPGKNKVTLVSIPRDLWVPDLNDKVNTAYSFGESKRAGSGLLLAKSAISKIFNQPVDYAVRLNFEGFVEAVDLVGGLDINVDRTFNDHEYPIDGKENDLCGNKEEDLPKLATASSQLEAFPCRYMTIHFDKGPAHLDGKTALEFVRSRHAEGDEGTDFARSARQEKIIKAFKDKVLSPTTIFNPFRIVSLYSTLKANIDTDIAPTEMDDFVRLAQSLKEAKIQSAVLDYGDDIRGIPGLLSNPPISSDYNFGWVLIPRTGNGNFSEIQQYINCEIESGNCPISKVPKINSK